MESKKNTAIIAAGICAASVIIAGLVCSGIMGILPHQYQAISVGTAVAGAFLSMAFSWVCVGPFYFPMEVEPQPFALGTYSISIIASLATCSGLAYLLFSFTHA